MERDSARVAANTFTHEIAADLCRRLCDAGRVLIDPEHGICWRVKSPEAAAAKLLRTRLGAEAAALNDYIGIRVVAVERECLAAVRAIAERWAADWHLLFRRHHSTMQQPAADGYRAEHIDFALDHGARWGLPDGTGVEVQLTTWLHQYHGMLSHRLSYKVSGADKARNQDFLANLDRMLSDVEEFVARELAARTL